MHEVSVVKRLSKTMQTEKDLRYATKFLKPLLGVVGAWPISADSSNFSKILRRTEHVITYSLFFLLLVPSISHMLFKEKNGNANLKFLPPLVNSTVQCFKYTILLYRTKELGVGLEMIRRDWQNASKENRLIFLSKAKIARRVVVIATITIYAGGVTYRAILPLLRGTIVTPDNVTIRPLPCPFYFYVINEQASPYYEAVYTLQNLAGFVTFAIVSGSSGICALLVLHTCCMLEILTKMLRDLADKTNISKDVVHQKIIDIVEYQTKMRIFLNNSEKITQFICFAELYGATTLICLVGYYILMEWQDHNTTATVTYSILNVSFIFSIFILCYVGQFLIDESNTVGKTSCTVNWYRLPNKHARGLVLIIAMSHYPTKLIAGKMTEMSLATFTDVLKVAMAYLNMLRNVM